MRNRWDIFSIKLPRLWRICDIGFSIQIYTAGLNVMHLISIFKHKLCIISTSSPIEDTKKPETRPNMYKRDTKLYNKPRYRNSWNIRVKLNVLSKCISDLVEGLESLYGRDGAWRKMNDLLHVSTGMKSTHNIERENQFWKVYSM